jgi:adenylate cyclase
LTAPLPDEGFRLSYVLQGEPKSVEFHQPEVLIGRSSECHLVLTLPGMSRRHALIQQAGDGWMIIDQNSRNGTYVNRQRVTHQRLHDGDEISFGAATWAPLTISITFHQLPETLDEERRVVFDDRRGAANVSLSINVEDYEHTLGGGPRTFDLGQPLGRPRRTRVSIIDLFKQVGEVLLSSVDLDDMLGKVVKLALDSLPVQRGFICLCDDTAATITPKTTRTKGLAGDESITISRSIARAAIHARQALLVTDAAADTRFAQAASIQDFNIHAAMCAPLYHAGHVQGLIYVDTNRPEDRLGAQDLELLTALGGLTAVGIEQARLREDVNRERAIRARLARYSSPAVVEQIVTRATNVDGEMLSEEREVSVLFGDLTGFTAMAEGMEPAEVARLLNGAFEVLTRAVFLHEGTLDKYMGDAVMAIFGAPLPQADHAERAVRAALRMLEFLAEFNRSRPAGQQLRMRIGINSGKSVAGDLGSPLRKDYTVVGDTVNVASRLESAVAEAGQVVIGPATYELVKNLFECRPLSDVRLKGKQQAMRPFVVVGLVADSLRSTTESGSTTLSRSSQPMDSDPGG